MPLPGTIRRGFTVTELLVIIGVVIVLLGLLFPALGAFRRSGLMAKSMANMRQIGNWMSLYTGENRDFVVPSQFDYSDAPYPGNVRSAANPPTVGSSTGSPNDICAEHCGTWSDILWTLYGGYPIGEAAGGLGYNYRYDSPDSHIYEVMPDFENPFRSAVANSDNFVESSVSFPTPFGTGASEQGLPGYFAANSFFNTAPFSATFNAEDGWWTMPQIRQPERSMYLVDSFAGEVIEDEEPPFQVLVPDGSEPSYQVDFRYNDQCLMLFLDGHVEPIGRFDDICDLEQPGGRNIRIRDLHRRTPPDDPCPEPGDQSTG